MKSSIFQPHHDDAHRRTSMVLLLGLLLSSTTICYIDRQVLSVSAPLLRTQFKMSNLGYSEVLFAFILAYAIFSPIAGRFIDRIGTRLGLAYSVVFWSLASMLHAASVGPWSLGTFRFLLGVGEAGNYPACVKTVAEQVPAERRALATGVFNVGAGLGAVIAPPFVVWLILHHGWRTAFLVPGVLGFLWVLGWLSFQHTRWLPQSVETLRRDSLEPTVESVGYDGGDSSAIGKCTPS